LAYSTRELLRDVDGKPIPQYYNPTTDAFEPLHGSGNASDVKLTGSIIQQPVDIQSRLQTTIQTHNAVSVAASGFSASSWIDCEGFDKLAGTMMNDASTNSYVSVFWSNDGVNTHGNELVFSTNTLNLKYFETPIKSRYARLVIGNSDTVAHTMSAWAYLKV
jgi:hypothetical protein